MCLEVAFKTGKSLRRSDRLRKTVPDRRTGNRKGSVSELGIRVRGTMNSKTVLSILRLLARIMPFYTASMPVFELSKINWEGLEIFATDLHKCWASNTA